MYNNVVPAFIKLLKLEEIETAIFPEISNVVQSAGNWGTEFNTLFSSAG